MKLKFEIEYADEGHMNPEEEPVESPLLAETYEMEIRPEASDEEKTQKMAQFADTVASLLGIR